MEQKIKQLISIWRWEWAHERHCGIYAPIVEMILELLVFVLYRLKKEWLFQAIGVIMQLPSWFYAFLGLDSSVGTGNLSFFLFYLLMLLNAWNAWTACERAVKHVDRDELSGSIYMICNQWYDRRQLAWGKWSWCVVSLFIRQLSLYLWVLLLVLIGSLNGVQRLGVARRLAGNWWISLVVMVFFMTVSFFNALSRRRRAGDSTVSFRRRLFWIPFIIGNLYKVRDAVFAVLELLGRPVANRIAAALHWMDSLYWLSPLSWMNIFRTHGAGRMWIQCGVCIAFSACVMFFGVRKYRNREFLS